MRIDINDTIHPPDENATNLLTQGHISETNELLSVSVKEADDLRRDAGMAQETGWERDRWDVGGILAARRVTFGSTRGKLGLGATLRRKQCGGSSEKSPPAVRRCFGSLLH